MKKAATDTIAAILAKETWTAEDHALLLKEFFLQNDAPDKFREKVAEMEAADPQPQGGSALKIGIARYMLCRFKDALDVLGQATDNKERRYFQALCWKCLHRYDQASEEFEGAKAKGWDELDVARQLVEIRALSGKMREADSLLSAIEGRITGTADWFYLRGLIDELGGLGEKAAEAYERARAIHPGHSAATFRLAYYCDLHGDENRAVELYRHCLSHPPVYANALLNLSVLYEDAGQYDKAVACAKRLLTCYPNHPRARLFLKDAEASNSMYYDEDQAKRIARRNAVLDIPVTDFELSVRARNCLKKMNIRNLGDLVQTTEAQLLGYKNFGETSLKEIKDMLGAKNLRLGQAMEEEGGLEGFEPEPQAGAQNEGVHNVSLDQVELSVRARKALDSLKVRTLGELATKTEAELLACRNFGQTSLNEVRERLAEYGLRLREPD